MKIFLDTAAIEDIQTASRWRVLDGVTTNPSLFARVGGSYDDVLREICAVPRARSARRSWRMTSDFSWG